MAIKRVYEKQKYMIISHNQELAIAYNFKPTKNVNRISQRILTNKQKSPKKQRIRSHKNPNFKTKTPFFLWIVNKRECVIVRVLTGVTNRGLDSVTTVEKKLDKPRSYVTRSTSHTHNLPCSTTHLSCRFFFWILITFWIWVYHYCFGLVL